MAALTLRRLAIIQRLHSHLQNVFRFFSGSQSHALLNSKDVHVSSSLKLKRDIKSYLVNHDVEFAAVRAIGPSFRFINNNVDSSANRQKFFRYTETFSTPRKWLFEWHEPTEKGNIVGSRDIFQTGFEVLQKFVDGEKVQPKENVALEALQRFFAEKDRHEKNLLLLCMNADLSETAVTSLLVHHLLSQLLPHPTNYYLDKGFKFKTDGCPCRCGETIQFGLTQYGSPQLFYGSADIVLFPSEEELFYSQTDDMVSTIFTIERKGQNIGHYLIPSSLKWNPEERIGDEDIVMGEVKRDTLEHEDTRSQMYKQAISVALCKKHKIENRCNTMFADTNSKTNMIPVCGLANNVYHISLYDAEHDFLLATINENLRLFRGDSRLRTSAVLDLWLVIYHHLFCNALHEDAVAQLQGSCSLVKHVGEKVFENITQGSRWLFQIEEVKSSASVRKPFIRNRITRKDHKDE